MDRGAQRSIGNNAAQPVAGCRPINWSRQVDIRGDWRLRTCPLLFAGTVAFTSSGANYAASNSWTWRALSAQHALRLHRQQAKVPLTFPGHAQDFQDALPAITLVMLGPLCGYVNIRRIWRSGPASFGWGRRTPPVMDNGMSAILRGDHVSRGGAMGRGGRIDEKRAPRPSSA